MMTRERALELIQHVWGQKTVISKVVIDEIAANKIDTDQNDLETLARIAELPEVLKIESFNTDQVWWLCCQTRAARDIQKAKEGK